MKNLKKRIAAAGAFICVAAASISFTACSDKNSSNGNDDILNDDAIEIITNEEGYMVAAPFQDGAPEGDSISLNGLLDYNKPDPEKMEAVTEYVPVTEAGGQSVTEYVPVTEAGGQSVTEYVPVTEAGGQAVTENGGQAVTEAIAVTEAVPVTEAVTVPPADDSYVGNTQMRYIYWLDIEKDIDYTFNGKFAKITFKVKDDAVSRVYPIAIDPDISTVGGVSLNRSTKVFNGAIAVGTGLDAPQDVSNVSGPVVYADKITAQPGDTVDFYISFDNNPGVAALMTWVSYDTNALEWQGIKPCGEFEAIASTRTQSGTSPAKE